MKQDSLDTEQEAEVEYLIGLDKKKTIEPDDGVELDREKDEHKERSGRVW